ncbi:helicase C-terminal domain-containing protein [Jeotgalibacillus soli]|uniref:helicase C-terminal domain-containing protein n=1 Tax=Jeotgalibacillus soli TaxID=889306 RepID=UPI000D08C544
MTEVIKISARRLAEYVYRAGSIDARIGSQTAMTEGVRIHQEIQRKYEVQNQKEVPLSREMEVDGYVFLLEGRCDGILSVDGQVIIDEIKSTSQLLDEVTDPSKVHVAQAVVYAWIVTEDRSLDQINVQITYVQSSTKEIKRFVETYDRAALQKEVEEMIQHYAPFALLLERHQHKRNESIKQLNFPFDHFRQGQRNLAGAVYKTINKKSTLFVQAPTGIGKTISTIFPTVKSMGERAASHLIYSTAKTITRTAAEQALNLMNETGLHLSSVTMTAKDKICFKEQTICQKSYCEYADGHFDRINGAVLDILSNETMMTRGVIETYAKKHRVCPFEYSMDLSYIADAMIGDYNYVFDPRVARKRIMGEQKHSTVLLVDEAHNLVDRAREMYSAVLWKSPFLVLSKGAHLTLVQAAKRVNKAFLACKKMCENDEYVILKEMPQEIIEALNDFYSEAERVIAQGREETDETLINLYFSTQQMLKVAELMDEQFYCLIEKRNQDVMLKIVCMDPSAFVKSTTKSYKASIFFSATLSPLPYVRRLLGGEADDYVLTIPSPFHREQLDVKTYPISTKYRDRERTLDTILYTLEKEIKEQAGNFLVFFPSFYYMDRAMDRWKQIMPGDGMKMMVQKQLMTEEEREEYITSFSEAAENRVIGFAVMGGMFSEGVDLPGKRLTGVAIVGVGLPQLSVEREQMKKYFQEQGVNGYNYAYVFPGINKVLQAGGRLIRSETDHGTLLLIDDRFTSPLYRQLLPPEW